MEKYYQTLRDEIDSYYKGRETNTNGLRLEGHLNSPITSDECLFILKYNQEDFQCKRHRLLSKLLVDKKIKTYVYDVCKSPWICLKQTLLSRFNKDTDSSIKDKYKVIVTDAIENYLIQKNAIYPQTDYYHNAELRNTLLSTLMNDDYLFKTYYQKYTCENYKNKFVSKIVPYGEFLNVSDIFHIEKELFYITCNQHGTVLGPTPLLLGVLDKLQTRFTLHLYWKLCDLFNKYPGYSMYEMGKDLINNLEIYQENIGEEFFDFIKLWEGFTISTICNDEINDVGHKDLYNTMCISLGKFPDICFSKRNILRHWDATGCNDILTRLKLEFTSLSKIFGHPVIDDLIGIRNLEEISCKLHHTNLELNMNIKGEFIHTFCKGYYKKNDHWPKLTFQTVPPIKLLKAYNENYWPSKRDEEMLTSDDWNCIKFEKNFEYDTSIDTTELLSDKSCAMPLSFWTQTYDHCAFKLLHNQNKPKLEIQPTRVILRFLRGKKGEVEEVKNEIEEKKYDKENDIGILCRKEREMKREGRLFVRLTYRARLEQTASEANIAKFIFTYLKYQTMSDTETGVAKKIGNFVKVQAKSNAEIINIDFSKWNMTQRSANNTAIAGMIDDLFGLKNVYKSCHERIQRCFIMGNSRVNPPRISKTGLPEPGYNCHTNQYGGLEGMRQKLWTITTIMAILHVGHSMDLEIDILGQGDNIVVLLYWKFYQLDNKQFLREAFLTQLERTFKQLGLIMKKEETWVSSRLFEYGKSRWLNGVQVSSGTKRASRVISDENDGLSTFESGLSSIATACETIAKVDYIPDSAFICYTIELANYFLRYRIVSTDRLRNRVLHYWPNIIGGLPLSTLFSHTIRGHDDSLVIWINIFKTIYSLSLPLFKEIIRVIPIRKRSTTNLNDLIIDIYSLNIMTLRIASLAAKKLVEETLFKYATNPEVTSIYAHSQITEDAIIQRLITIRPFYASLFSEMIRNSNYGMYLQLKNKLLNVQTITKLTEKISEVNPFQKIKEVDNDTIITLKDMLNEEYRNKASGNWFFSQIREDTCSYKLAKKIREESWGVEIEGVSQPHPSEIGQVYPYTYIPKNSRDKSILIMVSEGYQQSQSNTQFFLGPRPVYHGSMTKIKSRAPLIKFDNPHPFLRALRNLFDLQQWIEPLDPDRHLTPIFNILFSEKYPLLPTGFDKGSLKYISGEIYGGSIQHRFHSITESRGALINSINNITTHVSITTSSLQYYISTGRDYTLFFQELFLYIIASLNNARCFYPFDDLPGSYGYLILCDNCVHEHPQIRFKNTGSSNIIVNSVVSHNTNLLSTLKISLPPIEYQDFQYNTLDSNHINIVMSMITGIDIGIYVEKTMLTTSPINKFLGEITIESSNHDVNLTEVKSIDLIVFIAGLCIGSYEIRRDLSDSMTSSSITKLNNVYVPLASILINSGRLNELAYLGGLGNSNSFKDTLNGGNFGIFVAMCIRNIYNYYTLQILDLILKILFLDHEVLYITTLPDWIIKQWYSCIMFFYSEQLIKIKEEKTNITQKYNDLQEEIENIEITIKKDQTKILNFDTSNENINESHEVKNTLHKLHLHKRNHKELINKVKLLNPTRQEVKDKINRLRDKINSLKRDFTVLYRSPLNSLDSIHEFVIQYSKEIHLPLNVQKCRIIDKGHIRTLWRDLLLSKEVKLYSNFELKTLIGIEKNPCINYENLCTSNTNVSVCGNITAYPFHIPTESIGTIYYEIIRHLSIPLFRYTNSPSKIISILSRLTFKKSKIQSIVTLADGSFSLSSMFMHLFPTAEVFFNTLINTTTYPMIDYYHLYPPAFLGDKHINPIKIKDIVDDLLKGETDLRREITITTIINCINERLPDPKVNILTCDISHTDISSVRHVYSNVIKLWNYIDKKHFIIIFRIPFNAYIIKMLISHIPFDHNKSFIKPLQESISNGMLYLVVTSKDILHNFTYNTDEDYHLIELINEDTDKIPIPSIIYNIISHQKHFRIEDPSRAIDIMIKESNMIINYVGTTIANCYLSSIICGVDKRSWIVMTSCEHFLYITLLLLSTDWYDIDRGVLGNRDTISIIGKKPLLLQYINLLIVILSVHKLLSTSPNKFKWVHFLSVIRGSPKHIKFDKVTKTISSIDVAVEYNKEKSIWVTQKTDIYSMISNKLISLREVNDCKSILSKCCIHSTPEYIERFITLHCKNRSKIPNLTGSVVNTTQAILVSIISRFNQCYSE